MDGTQLIAEISARDVDVAWFAQLAIGDDQVRDLIVRNMLGHPHIMVYYHCYYVVERATQARPELFYAYWHDIASLLQHKNSYHRDFGLSILANLTQVDQGDLFSTLVHDYFAHIDDVKFMTGQCCVRNSLKILRNKPAVREQVIALLLEIDQRCTYTAKQKEVLKADVLDVLDGLYAQIGDRERVNDFIRVAAGSSSPKTRRKARMMVEKHGL